MAVDKKRKRVLDQLKALRSFDKSPTVRKLRNELKSRLKTLETRAKARAKKQREQEIRRKHLESRLSRSRALKKYHHYIRLIHDNYPEIAYSDIRKMFKIRKKGQEVEIPDVVWQNPSP